MNDKTQVVNSRKGKRLNLIWRRRRCITCGAQFTTYESALVSSVITIKDGRQVFPFSHYKLLLELLQACDHLENIDEAVPYIASTIEQELCRIAAKNKNIVSKEDIYEITQQTLQRFDPIAYVKYISRHKGAASTSVRRALKTNK